jgi:excisionase family DNA binding protein
MNKQDAADYLNISVRTLQRSTTDGKISVGEVRGRTGMVTDYTTEDLDRYKQAEAEREANPPAKDATRYVRPHVIPSDTPLTSSSEALQRTGNDEALTMFVSMLSDAMRAHETQGNGKVEQPSITDLSAKFSLSFGEAARLSGVPESHLRAAHADGSLRGAKIGRGVRVTPEDVKKYVEGRMKGSKR